MPVHVHICVEVTIIMRLLYKTRRAILLYRERKMSNVHGEISNCTGIGYVYLGLSWKEAKKTKPSS